MNKVTNRKVTSKVAAIQMCPGADVSGNLKQAAELIGQAVAEGASLVVLPENFAYSGLQNIFLAAGLEYSQEGPVRRFLAEQARKHQLWIVGGTIPVAAPDADEKSASAKVFAASIVVNPMGEEVARYNKIHLFDVQVDDAVGQYCESDQYLAGEEIVVVETDFGTLGLSVCYDLRFPELYRQLIDKGAEILVVPSAFTSVTGEAHWEILLRARAVENLCYVVAANQGNRTASKPTWGGTCIVDPWGRVLAEQADGIGVVCAELDLNIQKKIRGQLPALEHRRVGVVKRD